MCENQKVNQKINQNFLKLFHVKFRLQNVKKYKNFFLWFFRYQKLRNSEIEQKNGKMDKKLALLLIFEFLQYLLYVIAMWIKVYKMDADSKNDSESEPSTSERSSSPSSVEQIIVCRLQKWQNFAFQRSAILLSFSWAPAFLHILAELL